MQCKRLHVYTCNMNIEQQYSYCRRKPAQKNGGKQK